MKTTGQPAQRTKTAKRPDTWTTTEAAAYLGLANASSARSQLNRWRIRWVDRVPETGEKCWVRADIIAAKMSRPGQGARTDLHDDDLPDD